MIRVTADELKHIVATLEKALSLHAKWREDLLRVLVCRLPVFQADMVEDAHHQCAFGRWLYNEGNVHFRDLAAFNDIEELHKTMHDSARDICLKLEATGMVTVDDYNYFHARMSRFSNELVAFQNRVVNTLKNVDPLTGALTHAKLLEDLKAKKKKIKENGKPCSLLLMGFDLKEINQNHGRDMGDSVLQKIITCIRDSSSPVKEIYRYGGGEFVMCLPGENISETEVLKDNLIRMIEKALADSFTESSASLHIYYGTEKLDPNASLEELLDRPSRFNYTVKLGQS